MTTQPAIDWRSILLGFAAACTALTLLSLVAPIQDKYLLAGVAGATTVVMLVLAARAKPQVAVSH